MFATLLIPIMCEENKSEVNSVQINTLFWNRTCFRHDKFNHRRTIK